MRTLAGTELDFNHWNEFSSRLSGPQFQLQFPKRLLVSVTRDQIRVKHAKKTPVSFCYALSKNASLYLPEIHATLSCRKLSKKPKVFRKSDKTFEWFDRDELSFPLTVRSRKAGDRFQPLGQTRPVKLKGFLINQHVPSEERDHLPLVFSEDRIVWVGGVALGEPAKVTGRTRHVVEICLAPGDLT